MSDFINTIDELGDDVVFESIIDNTITEFKDNNPIYIRANAFRECTSLREVDLPNITNVGPSTFYGCAGLEKASFDRLTTVVNTMFTNCSNLSDVNIPSVITIDAAGFQLNSKLKVLDCPKVTEIKGANVFSGTMKLETLILRSETPCVAGYANLLGTKGSWGATKIANETGYIYVPKALIEDYKVATNWTTYANQFRALEDWTIDGTTTGKLATQVHKLIDRTISGDYVNEDVTSIRSSAFQSCKSLTSVSVPNVSTIKAYAFKMCTSLTSVNAPNVTTIGTEAFHSCNKLTMFDGRAITALEISAFYNASSLKTLILRSETLCSLGGTSVLYATPIKGGTGYVYVPSALISEYQSATNWSTIYASHPDVFRALEDYTVDGTITGALDESKI